MIPRFHTKLSVQRVDPDSDDWVLTSTLVFESAVLGRLVVVPAGTTTDFASVPRLPLAFWLFGDVAQEAAVVHDHLYSTGEVSRKLADEVFAEASKACGVSAWRRGPMWLGVRLFGGSRYTGDAAAPQPGPEQHPAGELERDTALM
ncbi:DUF1353 domain-containing protein [Massilia sp. DD77]|uniref:DUF1353 domain-containing protein n=1 Tax=Massilia sp. DD77 TaxID=3109349 RepID=UPI002FFE3052